jgi:predicted GNAT family N-acyltransferase
MSLHFISISHGSLEYEAECALRHEVLRQPLGLSLYDEDLDAEKPYRHFGLLDEADELVACVQVVHISPTAAKLRQMAVTPQRQGQGLGRHMILAVEAVLRADDVQRMTLHARVAVLGFYHRLGYVAEGDEFVEVGIPHRKMSKVLGT